jgi:alpha/beta superfamily hydrolase
MKGWPDCATWTGDGLRREVFFFDSRGTRLYGSLYAGLDPARPIGVVACSSWGAEADRSDPLVRSVALAMARLGGAAMVFHYPGYGDSCGDLASVGLSDLTEAACDAIAEASRRRPGTTWIVAGFMFGASVACLARQRLAKGELLLIQPALQPGRYMRWLAEHSKRQPLRYGVTEGMAYGYPVPRRMLDRAPELDAEAEAALASLEGEATVVRYPEPAEDGSIPARFERVEAPGSWRFGATLDPGLVEAAAGWLERRVKGGGG